MNLLEDVFISCGCITNHHKFDGLKQQTYGIPSPFWRPETPKSRCQQATLSPEALRDNSLLASASFWWLLASGGRCHCLACGCIAPNTAFVITACVCVHSPNAPLIRTPVMVVRAHWDNIRCSHLEILNLVISAKRPFSPKNKQNKKNTTYTGLRLQCRHNFGTTIQPIIKEDWWSSPNQRTGWMTTPQEIQEWGDL